jgi:hypothetical protein
VTSFGAFVDIGVHHDGLVHVSQLGARVTKESQSAPKPGDRVQVRVLKVDLEKKQISLTMRTPPPERKARPPRKPLPARRPAPAPKAAADAPTGPGGGDRPKAPSRPGPRPELPRSPGPGDRPRSERPFPPTGRPPAGRPAGRPPAEKRPESRRPAFNNPFAVLAGLKVPPKK